MTEITEHTLTAYNGPEFQQRLMWQLLVEPEFAEKIIPRLAVEYFDEPNLKRLFVIILEYFKEFDKVPNLQNKSIEHAINLYKTPNNKIEEESLFSVIKRITLWNERILNNEMLYDGDVIQKSANLFIKQQEYRKLGEGIIRSVKTGAIKDKNEVAVIEENFIKISEIGNEEDDCEEVIEGVEHALRKEFRQTIPTGVEFIDELTGGGLGKGEFGLILTPSGVGKAQPLSSKILTPTGWINMGDIKIGCEVIGSDGKQQKVLGVYPQGERDIYKVDFNDGTSALCDEEHLWSVNSINQRTANTTINVNGQKKHIKTPNFNYIPQTLKEIRKKYLLSRNRLNYRIPIIKEVEFKKNKLLINPYLLGVLIGDGGLSNGGVRFTNIDTEIIDKITEIINIDYNKLSVKQVSDTITYSISGKRGSKNKLFSQIKELKLDVCSNKKFIPDNYKFTSINDRILLLQGLLDTDGYASKQGRIQYTTTSKILAYDVREVILSLGGFCKIREKIPKYKYLNEIKIGEKSYILTISFSNKDIKPFYLKRKQNRVIYRDRYKNNKYISNIEYSHKEEAQCIFVENEDSLYVTDDYILTHNTTLLTIIANTAYEQEEFVAQIVFEDTKDQIKRKHYTIWSKIPLDQIDSDEKNDIVKERVYKKIEKIKGKGKLVIKKFSQEDTTIRDIRNWMLTYQKKHGIKFTLLVLDYLDCVESNKRTSDKNESELSVVKSFEALSSDFNIPAWSAVQSNRSGFDAEYVEAHQTGGSIKRIQKSHFFMSVAKTPEQKEANLANIRIIKARFAKDGQTFNDVRFDNNQMLVQVVDDQRKFAKYSKGKKHHDSKDVDNLVTKAETIKEEKVNNQSEILADLTGKYQEMVNTTGQEKKEESKTTFVEAKKQFEKPVNIEELEKLMDNPEDIYDEYKNVKDELIEVGKNQKVKKEE